MSHSLNYLHVGKLLAILVTFLLVCPIGSAVADKPGHGSARYGHSKAYGKGHSHRGHSYGHGGYSHRPQYNHHGYHRGNYGHYNRHRYDNFYGGGSYFFGGNPFFYSPFGLSFSYTNQDYGFGVSSARYYRPSYGYYGTPNFDYLDYARPNCAYSDFNSSYYAPRFNEPLSAVDRIAAQQLMSGMIMPEAIAPSVPASISPSPMIITNAAANQFQIDAESAFREGRYDDAIKLVDQAIASDNANGQLYLFSSQAEFAVGNFAQAVADLNIATEWLPSEKWTYVAKNYRNFYGKNDYVMQMERLSNEIANDPTDARLLTLRGFQYGAIGYPKAASKDFRQALSIQAGDMLTRRIMPILGETDSPATAMPVIEAPVPPQTVPKQEQLPPPNRLEEIQAPLSMLIPKGNPARISPELNGPSQ